MSDFGFDEYQQNAVRTAGRSGSWEQDTLVAALGLAGEAGEAGEVIKKHIGHGHTLDIPKLAKEIGDVLWYAAVLADQAELRLSDIARMNNEKLRRRYPDGFSTEASLARVDVDEEEGRTNDSKRSWSR